MISLAEARAVPGQGLEGDRYFSRTGTWSYRDDYYSEVTLIEWETIEALRVEHNISLQPGYSRRNIVTQGVALNGLVGREFYVGGVLLKGERLCEPCCYLEKKTGQVGLQAALAHRGGLRAYVLTEGAIKVGDSIEETAPDA